MNNTICSIYLDEKNQVPDNIINYLKDRYFSIFLCGSSATTKYHRELPYVYYNYIKYHANIDIILQNIVDIQKLDFKNHKIFYIYDEAKHDVHYKKLIEYINNVEVICTNKTISQKMLNDTFGYKKEIIYV